MTFDMTLRGLMHDATITAIWFRARLTHRIAIALTLLLLSGSGLSGVGLSQVSKPKESSNANTDSMAVRISQLIERLADPNYSSRINAQAELERIGVVALDQLHSASFHPDPQIAAIARYIVQSNQFTWAWETDTQSVRKILLNYGSSQHADKSAYIDQLQRLEHDEGFAALCRLVRYETQSGLAKRAALILMRSKPIVEQSAETRKESLHNSIVGGQSTASRWVLKYASSSIPFDLDWWRKTLEEELSLLQKNTGETSLDLVADLNRWVIEQISETPDLRDQALSMGRSLLTLGKSVPTLDSMIGNRTNQANEFAQWALKVKLPELVQEQHSKLPQSTLTREFLFGYLLAESFMLQGKTELANKVAQSSLRQVACDELGDERKRNDLGSRDPIRNALDLAFERRNVGDLERRAYLADLLKERGQFAWAESEYMLAIYKNENYQLKKTKPKSTNQDPDSEPNVDGKKDEGVEFDAKNPANAPFDLTLNATIVVMWKLSEMLQSQSRHIEAANVLEPFVERFNNEPMFKRQLTEGSRLSDNLMSSYHLYRGDEAREEGEMEKAKEHYWNSIGHSSDNVDALIGLYKISMSEKEQAKRLAKLKEIISEIRVEIRETSEALKTSSSMEHSFYISKLANHCNTLAWVVANTEGSKEEALFLSRKACTLNPESAEYLDTLAHCYAAMGKYQDAVQQQRRAVEIKPHHPELKKALYHFETKLRDSK
ncbi:MAG: hypothetical protein NTU79_01535 [Planctomycetota bacterium]|nr:hypothetical protein [Planctomycetota bacterium]